jgi:hypothetical protein
LAKNGAAFVAVKEIFFNICFLNEIAKKIKTDNNWRHLGVVGKKPKD